MRPLRVPAAIAALAAAFAINVAHADDYLDANSANLALWGQWVAPTGAIEDGGAGCTPLGDLCEAGPGGGAHARFQLSLGDGRAILLEILGDMHRGLSNESASEQAQFALYGAAGGHFLHRGPNIAYGLFGAASAAGHMGEDESSVHVFGGLEGAIKSGGIMWFGQIGAAQHVAGEDALERMFFGRIGARAPIGAAGLVSVSGAAGYAPNFDSDDAVPNRGYWLQLAALYEHQATDALSLFGGYQGDFVSVTDSFGLDSAFVHALKLGARMTIGGPIQTDAFYGAGAFDFVNLRAPVTLAGEMN